MGSNELATWVQAGASVVALVIAVCVPLFQHWLDKRHSERVERVQAVGLAAELLPEIVGAIHDLENLTQMADLALAAQGTADTKTYVFNVGLPHVLFEIWPRAHVLGVRGAVAVHRAAAALRTMVTEEPLMFTSRTPEIASAQKAAAEVNLRILREAEKEMQAITAWSV